MSEKGIIGIDIGGTKTRISLLKGGKLEDLYLGATEQNPKLQLELLKHGIDKVNAKEHCLGIGIACPSPLDRKKGIVLSPPNLKQWENFNLKGELENYFKIPVKVENDANAGALGEAMHGAGKNCSNLFYFTISTGIGSGIIIDNKIYGGSNGLAGELWPFVPTFYSPDDNGLYNEKVQPIIDLSSGNGIVKQIAYWIDKGEKTIIPKDNISTYTIIDAYRQNDSLAIRVVERAKDVLAATINFAVSVLDPDMVVLGGGLCFDESVFVEPIKQRVKENAIIDAFKNINIVRAELWENAAVYGAASLFE